MGYVPAAAVTAEGSVPTLKFMSEKVALSAEAKLSDDPEKASHIMTTLKAGSEVKLLGIINNAKAYVETKVDGKIARGFINKAAVGR